MTDFRFKQFSITQEANAMKVGTDGVLIGAWVPVDNVSNALDIGAGTGLIALMLAQRGVADVTALEIDPASAAEAELNVNRSPWCHNVRVANDDFLKYNPGRCYDLIVSNPPFFEETLHSPDPRRAAARSEASLPIDQLIGHASELLSSHGRLAIILPNSRRDALIYLAAINHLHINVEVAVAHREGKPPRRLMALMSRNLTPIIKQSLYINSLEFSELTKDFYL